MLLRYTHLRSILMVMLWGMAMLPAFSSKTEKQYFVGDTVNTNGKDLSSFFTINPIPDSIFNLMKGKSYKDNCPIQREDLRYLRILHQDIKKHHIIGELVCHASISKALIDIFKQLHAASYPIERMRLIDNYNADDETSMRANNSSCFNYRTINHSTVLSKHGKGMAIDINPLYNPYQKGNHIEPATARKYTNRSSQFPYKITKGDLCYRLFTQHGFHWGGDWKNSKDYQHFEHP